MHIADGGVVDPASVLFVVLDSCRYDSFAAADAPNMKKIGALHKVFSPSHFTFGSHAAMFVGFTPGTPYQAAPIVNPKFAKIFKLVGPSFPGKGGEGFILQGRNIIDGFRNRGYRAFGTGAVGWFDPGTQTSKPLIADFEDFYYPGNTFSLAQQLAWLNAKLDAAQDRPVFAFLNVGETHVPYYFDGAPWSPNDSPCVPFQTVDRAEDCRVRQRACVEFVDKSVAPLLERFANATTIICADHGDCWGEDGLWEHGISHPMTLTVPLLARIPAQQHIAV